MSNLCSRCGQPISGDSRFCSNCGLAVAAPTEEDDGALYWSAEFPLVTSRFFLGDMFKFLSLTWIVLVVVTGLMTVAAGEDAADALKFVPIWAIAVGALGLLVLVISFVVLGNRAGALYRLDDQGLAMVSRSKAQPLNELSQWLGIMTGSARLWASGVLAQAGEKVYIRWKSVHGVRLYPSDRVIELSDSFHMAMRVYCPADIYPQVASKVNTLNMPATRSRGILAMLGWLILTVFSTLLGLIWEPKVNDVGFMVVLTGMFVFMSGLLPGMLHRGLGLFGLLSGLCALGHRGYHLLMDPRVWRYEWHFWPALLATLGCAMLVTQACYQIFRKERPGQEMVLFDADLDE